jgi:N-acetyl-gamma-glutamylphosphate reductase
MMTDNWHKNTPGAVKFCTAKGLPYELIHAAEYKQFLTALGKNKKLVFFPHTPETLSRIVVEARMMGMSTITNQNIGATKEEWFQYKGKALINIMKAKKTEIFNSVKEILDGK